MTIRSFLTLAGATAVAVLVAGVTSISWSGNDAVSGRGDTFLPALTRQADEIGVITVHDGADTMTLRRDGSGFVDSSGYPVKDDVVRKLVTSISVMTIEERKTADPSRHGDLDLNEPGGDENENQDIGEQVTIAKENGSEIASVILGKSDYTVGGIGGGQFVREGGQDQTYLVRGSVTLPYARSNWFDTTLVESESDKTVRVRVFGGDADEIVLTRADEKLALTGLPDGKIADETRIERIAGLLDSLDFSDVRAASPAEPGGRTIAIETVDGLSVDIASLEETGDKEHWVRISAKQISPGGEDSAKVIAERVDGFEFKLSRQDSEILDWTVDDLTKDAQS